MTQFHLPDHCGEKELAKRLRKFYYPKKREKIKEYLKTCKCIVTKNYQTPRNESKESKRRTAIKARNYLDVIQIDTYKYDDHWYLTIRDVATGRTWIRKLIKV